MYQPREFAERRIEVLHAAIAKIGFASVVTSGRQALEASHVPVELDRAAGSKGVLRFHLARANRHQETLCEAKDVLLLFQGTHSYVSPSWYPSKKESGRVVPTWNYVVIQAAGVPQMHDDPAWLRAHLACLTGQFEHDRVEPWTLEDAPAAFIDGLCRAIVGFEVKLDRLEGKWKMSQNRPMADRQGVVTGLRQQGDPQGLAVADEVAAASRPPEQC